MKLFAATFAILTLAIPPAQALNYGSHHQQGHYHRSHHHSGGHHHGAPNANGQQR